MRKLLKKFVTGFVCLFLLSTTVFAAEEILPVSSSFIYGIFSDIIAESDGQLLITFHLNSPAPMTELGASSIEIYENNGRTTKLVDTIYATDRGYEHMLGSGTFMLATLPTMALLDINIMSRCILLPAIVMVEILRPQLHVQ